ncbi:MAG: phosphatase PAP2 family protein [Bacteroidaceae bacterium]|nr:phosphatase PAP2 family protein [Bacteroidaceae bacterium]
MKQLLLTIGLCIGLLPLHAQEDSTSVTPQSGRKNPYFQPTQLIAPAVLITAGAWGLCDKSPVDWLEKRARYDMNPNYHKTSADEYLQYAPTAVHPFLGFIPGVKSRHNFRDRVIASATAHAFMAAVTNTVKYTVREQRPDSEARNSFFSGHTATAFTGAELMRIEYGWGYGSAAYAVATGVAFMRVYNKRHWVGDVLAGAGVGILCANAGYWMLPVWKRWFKIDDTPAESDIAGKHGKSGDAPIIVAAPFYEIEGHAAGLTCNIVF